MTTPPTKVSTARFPSITGGWYLVDCAKWKIAGHFLFVLTRRQLKSTFVNKLKRQGKGRGGRGRWEGKRKGEGKIGEGGGRRGGNIVPAIKSSLNRL